MNQTSPNIIAAAEAHVIAHFEEKISSDFVFHDIQHTKNVVNACRELAIGYHLDDRQLELLLLAAWFHDTGYDEGQENHEIRGCEYLVDFLKDENYSQAEIDTMCACIMATKMPQQPNTILEEIICDADMSHLGKKIYWNRCGRIRQELLLTRSKMMSDLEWIEFELSFMTNHSYHTDYAEDIYGKRKNKHIRQLVKQKLRLNPKKFESVEVLAKTKTEQKASKKDLLAKNINHNQQEIKELRLGRGVETMYRTTYRTHVSLSAIADNKANIMLSINAIIISILISSLVPQAMDNPKLILPTAVLLIVCLTAMVFATLSTRPKVTKGQVSREDILAKRSNLLFFGNYYNMELDDFDWGIREMIKDSDFLYSSMTRDLYYLGIVLAKKYQMLSYCYAVFMYGLIIAVITLAISFL